MLVGATQLGEKGWVHIVGIGDVSRHPAAHVAARSDCRAFTTALGDPGRWETAVRRASTGPRSR